MNNQVEFPKFAGNRAAAVNQRLRDYAAAKKAKESAEETKKAEITAVNEHYNHYINKAEEEMKRLKAELIGFINVDEGETSLSTSLGNIHLTKVKDKWNWPTASQFKKIAKDVPDEFVKQEPVLNKSAVKKLATVTDDGKVIVAETGQLLDWCDVVPGRGESLTVKLNAPINSDKEAKK